MARGAVQIRPYRAHTDNLDDKENQVGRRKQPGLAKRRARIGDTDWNKVILRAKEVVESYDTPVTLRQLYYRLVSEGLIVNHQQSYKRLSAKTAQARREGWFPSLIDRTRAIERFDNWPTAQNAMDQAVDSFRLDRTRDQKWSIYLGVEKHGMSVQLMHWFGEMGLPILALGGYSSQTFVDVVKSNVIRYDRESVLLYAGDFDPSGVDIDRDFEERTEIFDRVIRVALRKEHLKKYDLPPMPGKTADARSASFILQHGDLIQVELDALKPEDLRKLYQAQIDKFWDKKAYKAVVEEEDEQKEKLVRVAQWVNSSDARVATDMVGDIEDRDDILAVMDAAADRL